MKSSSRYVDNNSAPITCQNCGTRGHHIKSCPNPITSLGIILYYKDKDDLKYLLVCRKNTIGFVEFIRGKYVNNDVEYIQTLFNVMTDYEIHLIQTVTFEKLWEYLWMDKLFKKNSTKLKRDFTQAINKFNNISTGYEYNNNIITLKQFIENKNTTYSEQEWGFPKGRRNYNESNFKAAKREFLEETNIPENDIEIISKSKTFSERYKSYDNVMYHNIYYIAEYKGKGNIGIDSNKREQYTEISAIKFINFNGAINKLRDYDLDKKQLLIDVNKYILDEIN